MKFRNLLGEGKKGKRPDIDMIILKTTEDYKDPLINYFSQIPYDKLSEGLLIAKQDRKKEEFPKNKFTLYVTSFEVDTWKNNSKIKIKSAKKIKKDLEKNFLELKGKKQITIGVNYDILSVSDLKNLKKRSEEIVKDAKLKTKISFVDLSQELNTLRITKTKEEIEIIKEGVKLSDKILNKVINQIKNCKAENDVHKLFNKEVIDKGLTYSFDTIIGSGKNGAEPHYNNRTKLNKGFCVIDFGIRYKGYCTDTTRTIYIGKPSKKEVSTYEKVLKVQKECIKKIKPGANLAKIDAYAGKKLGKALTHVLGHGVGIKVHEAPPFSQKVKTIAKEGMLITVEPGVYYKDKFGIRIEDMVLVTKDGCEVLTKIPKSLQTIKLMKYK